MWTLFWDMHSGGKLKEKWNLIFIEADKETAKKVFYNRFGHNPNRVTCTCCGEDYTIDTEETLEQLSAFHRGCAWSKKLGKYIEKPDKPSTIQYYTTSKFIQESNVLVIYEKDINPNEKVGEVPEQGYIWVN